jgi:Spy/CpxP family protein refolding chaperone
MKKGILFLLVMASFATATAVAENPKDVFKGKLFAPNVILEHREALMLSKDQFTAIRAAVVEVQAGVAEHEWDMQEAYQALMAELDKSPVDEDKVVEHAEKALLAENQVKKKQMVMLVRLRNLLTAEQVSYLESKHATR